MRTLDRYVLGSFLTSAMLWFVALMALRIVADLFINMDEFAKQDKTFQEIVGIVVTYYSYQSLVYFIELGGVMIVAAAAFTLARMNQTNELTAMLASGVSLHRVVWPIVLCAVLLGGMVVVDQELLIPPVAHQLVRSRDDVEAQETMQVRLLSDGRGAIWKSPVFSALTREMSDPVVIVRDENFELLAQIAGQSARPAEGTRFARARGWVITEGVLMRSLWQQSPTTSRIWTGVGPESIISQPAVQEQLVDAPAQWVVNSVEIEDVVHELTITADSLVPPEQPDDPWQLTNPRFTYRTLLNNGKTMVLGTFGATAAVWIGGDAGQSCWQLEGGELFVPSDLSADELTLRRSRRWLDYMSSSQLRRLLKLQRVSDPAPVMLIRHARVMEPLNNLVMLLLGLPFILSRERNIKASAGLCLLMVGTFYAFIYICRYIGLPPIWAAWLPVLLFGPVAIVMLDSVKT